MSGYYYDYPDPTNYGYSPAGDSSQNSYYDAPALSRQPSDANSWHGSATSQGHEALSVNYGLSPPVTPQSPGGSPGEYYDNTGAGSYGDYYETQTYATTSQLPAARSPRKSLASHSRHGHDGSDAYTCLAAGCASKPFRRKADLERHYKQIHSDASSKESYMCDYPRCVRAREPFGRRDHFRDHLREYHKENLCKRGGQVDAAWLRDRVYHSSWWRCSRCLVRVKDQDNGYQCPKCKTKCDESHRRAREQYLDSRSRG